jgi:hypothetical protein
MKMQVFLNGFTENKSGEQVEVKYESSADVVECKLTSTTKDGCSKAGLITQTPV